MLRCWCGDKWCRHRYICNGKLLDINYKYKRSGESPLRFLYCAKVFVHLSFLFHQVNLQFVKFIKNLRWYGLPKSVYQSYIFYQDNSQTYSCPLCNVQKMTSVIICIRPSYGGLKSQVFTIHSYCGSYFYILHKLFKQNL